MPQTLYAPLLGSIIAVGVFLLPVGPSHAAERCEAPPGTSGAEQYCETLPGGTGDREFAGGKRAGGSFDRRTRSSLERSGREGRGVLELPAGGSRANDTKRTVSRSEPTGSAVGSLGSALESGSTAGQGFIWLLVALGLGIAGLAWYRYRSEPKA